MKDEHDNLRKRTAGIVYELEEKLHFKSDKRIKFVGTVYDQELLKKIRENAYSLTKKRRVYSYTISLAKNREIAEEITQNTFYKAVSL